MTNDELSRWRACRDPQLEGPARERARQRLLEQYLPLVRTVVFQMPLSFPSAILEPSDLCQVGVIGLMDAFERFDPDYGVEFRTYASRRIRGQVLDELRKLDWIPRSIRQKGIEVPPLQSLENLLERKAQGFGSRLIDSAASQPPLQSRELEKDEDRLILSRGMKYLSQREQRVLSLYYGQGMNLRQIARLYSLTESRICQIHASALNTLREKAEALAA